MWGTWRRTQPGGNEQYQMIGGPQRTSLTRTAANRFRFSLTHIGFLWRIVIYLSLSVDRLVSRQAECKQCDFYR
ncbi:hypothetical protein AB6A40_001929 [Gnathostoma spinigerum]|uniref:Uncharacterized protein n=1 Tax=Gnathostoma spinigerum TaxID=75299 RepID=A0ABD6E6D0_9BILA